MSELRDIDEQDQQRSSDPPRPRAVGSPLPMGNGGRAVVSPAPEEPRRIPAASGNAAPEERTLNSACEPEEPAAEQASEQPSSIQRAMSGLRMAWPFVQKILPLLDGQVITAVSNLLTPHPQHHPPVAQVNLAPIEQSLSGLQACQDELRDQVAEQNTSFKRVEDRLEMVREATDRNTLEQQELMDDLKKVGRKVNIIAALALLLLAGSIAVNVVLYLHIRRVLP
jgi:hypothetical protein